MFDLESWGLGMGCRGRGLFPLPLLQQCISLCCSNAVTKGIVEWAHRKDLFYAPFSSSFVTTTITWPSLRPYKLAANSVTSSNSWPKQSYLLWLKMRAGALWLKNPVVVQFHAKVRGFKDTRNYSHPSEKAKLVAAGKNFVSSVRFAPLCASFG